MFAPQPTANIWQGLSADQQRVVVELLARLAVKVVLPVSTTQHQEPSHGLYR